MNTIEDLKQVGFMGFVPVGELMTTDCKDVPVAKGVYVVLWTKGATPKFVALGTGGHFKGKNPNVSISELHAHWIPDTQIVYIGKAGGSKSPRRTLQKRLSEYMRFGQGEAVGHWGGRYIWQIADAQDLIVCWKPLNIEEPATVETKMIDEFKEEHNGQRPFANLRD